MTVQSFYDLGERTHLRVGSLAFAVIGIALVALAPARAPDAALAREPS